MLKFVTLRLFNLFNWNHNFFPWFSHWKIYCISLSTVYWKVISYLIFIFFFFYQSCVPGYAHRNHSPLGFTHLLCLSERRLCRCAWWWRPWRRLLAAASTARAGQEEDNRASSRWRSPSSPSRIFWMFSWISASWQISASATEKIIYRLFSNENSILFLQQSLWYISTDFFFFLKKKIDTCYSSK